MVPALLLILALLLPGRSAALVPPPGCADFTSNDVSGSALFVDDYVTATLISGDFSSAVFYRTTGEGTADVTLTVPTWRLDVTYSLPAGTDRMDYDAGDFPFIVRFCVAPAPTATPAPTSAPTATPAPTSAPTTTPTYLPVVTVTPSATPAPSPTPDTAAVLVAYADMSFSWSVLVGSASVAFLALIFLRVRQ